MSGVETSRDSPIFFVFRTAERAREDQRGFVADESDTRLRMRMRINANVNASDVGVLERMFCVDA